MISFKLMITLINYLKTTFSWFFVVLFSLSNNLFDFFFLPFTKSLYAIASVSIFLSLFRPKPPICLSFPRSGRSMTQAQRYEFILTYGPACLFRIIIRCPLSPLIKLLANRTDILLLLFSECVCEEVVNPIALNTGQLLASEFTARLSVDLCKYDNLDPVAPPYISQSESVGLQSYSQVINKSFFSSFLFVTVIRFIEPFFFFHFWHILHEFSLLSYSLLLYS